MSGIRPPDNSPGKVRQTETRPDRPGGPEAARQVEEEAARFVRMVRSGRRPGERDAEERATGSRGGDADVGPASEHRDEGAGPVGERGRRRGDDFGQGDARDEGQPDAPPPGFRGDAILAGLGSARTPPARDHEVRGRELSELAQGIVTQVLVGNRDSIPELRVTLGGNLFDRTELRISRREGGIEVMISGGSAAAADFLARSGGELAGQLAQRLETRVVVQIAPPSAAQQTGGQDDRQDRRSRGLDALLTFAAG
jgi:hypothetical protein